MEKEKLKVNDYTKAVLPLVKLLQDKFKPNPLPGKLPQQGYRKSSVCVSDAVDVFGRQCVDLVQEGGGVHGIALAGYTYMLETMGIGFAKMAGTSAGAINTMLLSATLSKEELAWLQENVKNSNDHPDFLVGNLHGTDYYDTRSEKLLEYLSNKDLESIVDGHPSWRKIILTLFTGKVKLGAVKKEKRSWIKALLVMGISLLLMIASAALLVYGSTNLVNDIARIVAGVSLTLFVIATAWIISRAWQARMLWFLSEKLGINPGTDFEEWVKEKLSSNEVMTVDSLREKLELETLHFQISYEPSAACPPVNTAGMGDEVPGDEFKPELEQLKVKVEALENSCSNGNCKEKNITPVWDNLVAMAKDLPIGDPAKEKIAAERSVELMPLFMRMIKLQDVSCGYSISPDQIRAGAGVTLGPYTKELTIISTDLTNEMKVEFPAMHKMYWGDNFNISPALYVRASMAIPFFFAPFKVKMASDPHKSGEIDDQWKQFMKVEKRHEAKPVYENDEAATLFVDGGALSNFPINIYATPEVPIPRKPTIGIKLEYEEETLSSEINNVLGEVGSIVSTMRYFYDRDFISKNDMYKRTVRSIDTGQIHWLNFKLEEKEKLELFFRGALAAALFLISGHPDFEKNEDDWHEAILSTGLRVSCGKKPAGGEEEFFSIYEEEKKTGDESSNTALKTNDEKYTRKFGSKNPANKMKFGNEDLNNKSIRFKWNEYKQERLLALSRLRFQRNILKTFPKKK